MRTSLITNRFCQLKYRATISRSFAQTSFINAEKLLNDCETFLFDCDGVIWKGDSLVNGAAETLIKLRNLNKKVFFVTNNSSKSRVEMLSSSYAAALHLTKYPMGAENIAFVVGHEGIAEELKLAGIPYFGVSDFDDEKLNFGPNGIKKIEHNRDVGAVVVGVDTNINYFKIQYAQLCLSENENCQFIATNMDAVAHLTSEQEWAGAGAIVGTIKGCTGKEPILVGKPSSLLIDHIVDTHKVSRDKICMVGDRLDTDILFGLQNGMKTVLTLTGVTTKETLLDKKNTVIPHYYVNSIVDLVP